MQTKEVAVMNSTNDACPNCGSKAGYKREPYTLAMSTSIIGGSPITIKRDMFWLSCYSCKYVVADQCKLTGKVFPLGVPQKPIECITKSKTE